MENKREVDPGYKLYYYEDIKVFEKGSAGREWRIKNKEKIKEKNRQYCIKNKEKIKEKNRQYCIKNKEKIKEKKRKYSIENKEKIKEYNRQYCIENKEKIKKYNKENSEKRQEYTRRWYIKNREKLLEKSKEWRSKNKEKVRITRKKYYDKNEEKEAERIRKYRKNNSEKIREYKRQYRLDNLEKIKERNKIYKKNNTEKIREKDKIYRKNNIEHYKSYMNDKYKKDLKYNINIKMGKAIRNSLKKTKGIRNRKNGRHWETIVGYTVNELIKRLKKTIPKGYKWEDFLSGKLHIDHIIPIAVFNFTRLEHNDFKRCWALSNLKLLTGKENMIKSDKIDKPFQPGLKLLEK